MGFFDKFKHSYFNKFKPELDHIPNDAEFALYGEIELDVNEATGWREVFEGMGLICIGPTELLLKPLGQPEIRLTIANLTLQRLGNEINLFDGNAKYELESFHVFTEIAPPEALLPTSAQSAAGLSQPLINSVQQLLADRGAQTQQQ